MTHVIVPISGGGNDDGTPKHGSGISNGANASTVLGTSLRQGGFCVCALKSRY